jgi:hypothetical protein
MMKRLWAYKFNYFILQSIGKMAEVIDLTDDQEIPVNIYDLRNNLTKKLHGEETKDSYYVTNID